MTLLSAAMIVRDEEQYLADCLESIRHFVDEIIVVDTGSKDNTIALAKRFQARVTEIPWRDDFAFSRNEALKRCRGDWILYIDADERVDPLEVKTFREELAGSTGIAYTVRFIPKTGFTAYPEHRIFRNDRRIRFHGVIHERVLPAILNISRTDNIPIGSLTLTIRHMGYDADQTGKHHRNLPLLRKQVVNDPERIYLRWHLGCVLKAMGDEKGAETAWESAVEIVRKNGSTQLEGSIPYGELIRLRHDQDRETGGLLAEALRRFPGQYFLMWLKAMIETEKGRYSEAIGFFERLISVDSENLTTPVAYEAGIFHRLSLDPLASCYYKLGLLDKSLDCYERLERLAPENVEYRIKKRFVTLLAAKR